MGHLGSALLPGRLWQLGCALGAPAGTPAPAAPPAGPPTIPPLSGIGWWLPWNDKLALSEILLRAFLSRKDCKCERVLRSVGHGTWTVGDRLRRRAQTTSSRIMPRLGDHCGPAPEEENSMQGLCVIARCDSPTWARAENAL